MRGGKDGGSTCKVNGQPRAGEGAVKGALR
jgi:hypothetical protein